MADPFAILAAARPDAATFINAYQSGQAAQAQRIQQIHQQRAWDREDQTNRLLGQLFTTGGASQAPGAKGSRLGDMVGAAGNSMNLAGQVRVPDEGSSYPLDAMHAAGGAMTGAASLAAAPAPAAQAPTTLVDPSHLPARTDGIKLNPDVFRQLIQHDPKSAFAAQTMLFNADAEQFKQMEQRGGVIAGASYALQDIPDEPGRRAQLMKMAPTLLQYGIPQETIQNLDLSDTGLKGYAFLGEKLSQITTDRRADRRLNWDIQDDEADNARADLNTDSIIAHRGVQEDLTRRGQDISSTDRRRSQDLTDARGRRGQDMTDVRVRSGVTGGGRRPKLPAGTSWAPTPGDSQDVPVVLGRESDYKYVKSGQFFQDTDGHVRRKP